MKAPVTPQSPTPWIDPTRTPLIDIKKPIKATLL